MSRHLIAYEGRVSKDGRLVLPGALQWDPDHTLPVIGDWLSERGAYKVGRTVATMSGIERIDNELWADVWSEGFIDNEHCLTLDTTDCDIQVGDDNVLVFTRARILGAHLSPIESWIWDSE